MKKPPRIAPRDGECFRLISCIKFREHEILIITQNKF